MSEPQDSATPAMSRNRRSGRKTGPGAHQCTSGTSALANSEAGPSAGKETDLTRKQAILTGQQLARTRKQARGITLTPEEKLEVIEYRIANLQERVGANRARIEKQAPRHKQAKAVVLPEVVGFDMLLSLLGNSTLATKNDVRFFLRSGGVIPQMSMWSKQGGLDSGSPLRDLLQERLPLSTWSDKAAQLLAQYLAQLAGLSPSAAEELEHNHVLRQCVKYTRSLRTKNQEPFFDRFELSDDKILLFCSTLLLVIYRDYATDPQNGFFAILFRSLLVRPMSAKLRMRWEQPYPLSSEMSSAQKEEEFRQSYILWMEKKDQLDAEQADSVLDAGQTDSDGSDYDESDSDETAEKSLKTIPDLSWSATLTPMQLHQLQQFQDKPVPAQDVLKVLGYDQCKITEPFTDSEELLYLEAFLEYKKLGNPRNGAWHLFGHIAEIMARRSPAECIEHHYATKGLIEQPEHGTGNKREASTDPEEEAPPRKTSKSNTEKLPQSVSSSPTDFATCTMDNAIDAKPAPPAYDVVAEMEKRHRVQMAGQDEAFHHENSLRYGMVDQIAAYQVKLSDYEVKVANAQDETNFLYSEHCRFAEKAAWAKKAADATEQELRQQLHKAKKGADRLEQDLKSAEIVAGNAKKHAGEKDKVVKQLKQDMQDAEGRHKAALQTQEDLVGPSMRKRDRRIKELEDLLRLKGIAVPPPPPVPQRR